jgi:hypothetical protein
MYRRDSKRSLFVPASIDILQTAVDFQEARSSYP